MKILFLTLFFFQINLFGIVDTFLYCPWRDKNYHHTNVLECPFCCQFGQDKDSENFIIKRCNHCVVMLNKFPYAKAHLLIIPYRHVKDISDLNVPEQLEIMQILSICIQKVKKIFGFKDFNVGMNIGKLAGASIEDHLHVHLLPRYLGESGFQECLFHAKVIPFDMNDVYKDLYDEFNN